MPRTVFITGCSSGIGRATAILFARRGYQVVATARRGESLQELASLAQKENLSLRIAACDVTDEKSVQQAVAFAQSAFGRIDILVNNAGYGSMGPIEAVALEEARKQFEVNVFGAARLIQMVAPGMRAAGWGRIINVSSIAGKMVVPLGAWYSASKFALEALTDSLRFELEPFGVYTVSILPGPVKSDFLKNLAVAPIPEEMPRLYHQLADRLEQRRVKRAFELSAENLAEIILRAAEVKRPRPRYVITAPARVGTFIRPFFTDRMWDRMMKMFYGLTDLYRTPQKPSA